MRTRGPGVPRAPRGPRRAAPPPVRASGRGPSCGGRRAAAPGEAPAAFPNPQAKCPPRALRSPPRRRGLSFQQAARAGARVGLRLSPQRGPTRPPPPLSPTLLRSPTQEKWRNSAFQGAQRPGPQRRRRAQGPSPRAEPPGRRVCGRGPGGALNGLGKPSLGLVEEEGESRNSTCETVLSARTHQPCTETRRVRNDQKYATPGCFGMTGL
nr:proline-rich proteoglycan 2-like isoform X1 [Vulpes vulpes]